MVEINLLPWRLMLRQRQQRNCIMMILTCMILTMILGTLSHVVFNQRIRAVVSKIQVAEHRLANLAPQVEEVRRLTTQNNQYAKSVQVLKQIETNQHDLFRLLTKINSLKNVALQEVRLTDTGLTLKGMTNFVVLTNLLTLFNLKPVQIKEIQHHPNSNMVIFHLRFMLESNWGPVD